MSFRPHTPTEAADLAHSIAKMQGAPAQEQTSAPEASDQPADAVNAEADADVSQDTKPAGKTSFKKKA